MFPELDQVPAAQTLDAPVERAGEGDRRALYLRWRPRRFEDVVGQEHVTRTLRNAVKRGRLSHAYLLTGPRGTGKTSIARILYRAATCSNAVDGDPCNTCPTCIAALDGRSMDLIEIDAASNRGIDDIRDLREKVAYRPSEGQYRVYIVDEAHELTSTAWDAFLKTLEEPPDHAIFVLATTEAHKVPPTIVSRCQRFDFHRIPLDAMRLHLAQVAEAEGLDIEPAVLDRLAHAARGGLRDALSLLDQLAAYGGQRIDMDTARAALGMASLETVQNTVSALGRRDAAGVVLTLGEIVEAGADVRQFVEELQGQLRALMLVRVGAGSSLTAEFGEAEMAWLREEAPLWPLSALLRLVGSLAEALARLRDTQQLLVGVELALLEATQPRVELSEQPTPPVSVAPRTTSPRSTRPAPASVTSEPPAWPPEETHTAVPPDVDTPPSPPPSPRSEQTAPVTAAAPLASDPLLDVPPPTQAATVQGSATNLERLQDAWPDVLDAIKGTSQSIYLLLTTARLKGIGQDGSLVIAVAPGKLNERKAREIATRDAIQAAIKQTVGAPIRVQCVVGGDEAGDLLEDPVIRFAVKTFGGEPRRATDDEPSSAGRNGADP